MNQVVAGAGAMLFGFLIVYDTQQIFGSASAAFGGGKREMEYTVDMQLGLNLGIWESERIFWMDLVPSGND